MWLRLAAVWVLFFMICGGLGYQPLNRYDPTEVGLSDAGHYLNVVRGGILADQDSHWRYRLLVPYVARPIYKLAVGRVGSWDPAIFALLVANSLFIASTALLIVSIGYRQTADLRPGFIGALLFLSNFNVANLYLVGLVDSGEMFVLCLIAWFLM